MPLFMCAKCGCAENTALSDFWQQHSEWLRDGRSPEGFFAMEPVAPPTKPFEPTCLQCSSGHWHHEFPRKRAEGYVRDPRGFIYTQEQASGSASHMGPFEPVKLPEG